MSDDVNAPVQDQAAADPQPRHPAQPVMVKEEDVETWLELVRSVEVAEGNPELRALIEERVPPEILQAVDAHTDYEDFRAVLSRYQKEGLPHE